MNVIIRKGNKTDVSAVFNLMMELAIYEKGEYLVTNTVEQMAEDGFGENPVYGLLVAETENKIAGMAIYFIKYSTWRGKGLSLEDLIVTEKVRKHGIGKKLFESVIAEAKKINARTMHWQVLDWNTPAIDFYKKYNCTFEGEWVDCKLSMEQINTL
ncbi:MAG: GNAT family N-acetyltransferase [Bacteroidia bacterium]